LKHCSSRAVTSFARSCFLYSRIDKCSSCVPFFSYSISCRPITIASCSFLACG
jgi:hypothetical protein